MVKASVAILLAAAALTAGPALAGEPVGWRTDGDGVYPHAPPDRWSPEANVLWKAKLPSWSNATPVVAAGRVFVTSEPNELLCLDAADGRLLWRRAVALGDVWTDAEAAEAERKAAEVAALKKRYDELNTEVNAAYAAARKDRDNPQLKQRFKTLHRELKDLRAEIATYARYQPAQTEPNNGYASATPVTDGRHVWIQLGTGVAACFDVDGELVWAKWIDAPESEWGHSTSPVLAGGKLLLHVRRLQALEPLTGKLLWEAEGAARSWGTPQIARIGETLVAATARGDVVRVDDGTVLATGLGKLDYASPLLVGGVLYMIENGGGAWRLAPAADNAVTAEKLWACDPKIDRYYASPVLHEGLVYTVNQKGHFSVIDAKTGQVVNGQGQGVELEALGKGTVYPSPVLAGGRLLLSSDAGVTLVIEPGRSPEAVSTNTLEKFRGTPVMVGRRMFVRGYEHLYCIGTPQPEGK